MLFIILLIPLLGTVLGSACVFLLKDQIPEKLNKMLLGLASGVMVAAAFWSLIVPAMEMSEDMGKFSFVPAAVGLALGMGFLLLLDELIPHLHLNSDEPEGLKVDLRKSTMMILAVTLHNLPEGMAVGVAYAGAVSGNSKITMASAMTLAIGIALQNFPEGAIVSMPLVGTGLTRKKAFTYGALSGVVEPVGTIITILLTSLLTPFLPYLLAFAAGAMFYVVVEELIPEGAVGEHSNLATIGFFVGFILMMALDVALG